MFNILVGRASVSHFILVLINLTSTPSVILLTQDRKTRKRVGVFQDVVSDLKRYRELDAQGEKKDLPAETKSDKVDEEKVGLCNISVQCIS